MPEAPDDLEKLLGDVRKTITENERFILTLMEDVVDAGADSEDSGNDSSENDYEEL